MVISGSLGGVMVSTLAWNAIPVGSILALGAVFPIFITPMTPGCNAHDFVRAMLYGVKHTLSIYSHSVATHH